jgi:lipid A 3-O-deacylase
VLLLAIAALAVVGAARAHAQNSGQRSAPAFSAARTFGLDEIKLGALYHDIPALWSGFSRERPAADLNVELLFRPFATAFGGTLRPALGGTFNAYGETSKAYVDLRYEIEAPSGIFFGLGLGAAVHNGETDLVNSGRKALGSSVLFHPSAELGYRFDDANSLSVFADHISNGYSRRHNEAMDTLGVRIGHKFAGARQPTATVTSARAADFSGLYIGAGGGYDSLRANWSGALTAGHSGPAAAGFAGYLWQSGQAVFGVETDAAASRTTLSTTCRAASLNCEIAGHGLFSVRPRFGWVIDDALFYGTGGLAIATWDNRAVATATGRHVVAEPTLNFGVAVGAGIELKVTQRIAARAEVLHYGLPGKDLNVPGLGVTSTQFQSTVGRMGLSWTFD